MPYGSWFKNGNRLTIVSTDSSHYQEDTLSHITFFVSETEHHDWEKLKVQMRDSMAVDETLNILKAFELSNTNTEADRIKVIAKTEYEISLKLVCKRDILVAAPRDIQ